MQLWENKRPKLFDCLILCLSLFFVSNFHFFVSESKTNVGTFPKKCRQMMLFFLELMSYLFLPIYLTN